MEEQISNTLLGEVLPNLRSAGIFLLDYDELSKEEREELREWFSENLEPLLTPLAIDPGHPFPSIGSLSLSIAVELLDEFEEMDSSSQQQMFPGSAEETRNAHFAIVSLPLSIPRWRRITRRGGNYFVPAEQVIIANLDKLFGGMVVLSANCFRATRNADVVRNEEEAEDLLDMARAAAAPTISYLLLPELAPKSAP